jgi:predicted  nucleic acid-binding Zn-ribbon protein
METLIVILMLVFVVAFLSVLLVLSRRKLRALEEEFDLLRKLRGIDQRRITALERELESSRESLETREEETNRLRVHVRTLQAELAQLRGTGSEGVQNRRDTHGAS